jgi:hypothetical protein
MNAIQWDPSDDALMDELQEALTAVRSVPPRVVEAARAAYAWRSIDVELELLTLSYDSSLAETTLVRSQAAGPRMLVFDSENVTLELEVSTDVLMGQVVPAHAGRVILENPHGTVHETEADDEGFFLLGRPAACPVRLTWLTDRSRVRTEWLPI